MQYICCLEHKVFLKGRRIHFILGSKHKFQGIVYMFWNLHPSKRELHKPHILLRCNEASLLGKHTSCCQHRRSSFRGMSNIGFYLNPRSWEKRMQYICCLEHEACLRDIHNRFDLYSRHRFLDIVYMFLNLHPNMKVHHKPHT